MLYWYLVGGLLTSFRYYLKRNKLIKAIEEDKEAEIIKQYFSVDALYVSALFLSFLIWPYFVFNIIISKTKNIFK